MTDNIVKADAKHEVAKDFRSVVTNLESQLKEMADGKDIVAGTNDKPIVTNSQVVPIEHFFMEGVYVRKMTMYEGCTVIGAIHKHLHMCFLAEGSIVVADELGTTTYIAPCHILATPGIKRVLHAIEDSVWYNIHKNPTNTEDIKSIEDSTVAISYEEYEEYIKNK